MNKTDDLPTRFQAAAERLDGDAELLREMAAITSEDLPEVLDKTELDVEAGDCEAAARSLHKLKGMLSTFESGQVTTELHEMIYAARKGDADDLRQRYRKHKPEIDELIGEIADLVGHQSARSRKKE